MSTRVAKASIWAITGSSAQNTTVFALLIYLAHVLHPRDFGLMATVAVGLDLGLQIARWGQVELLQQPQYRNDAARNRSLRLSLGLAVLFAIAFVVVARPLADYFRAPELATMFYLCAPIFLLSGSSTVAEAVLRSEFRFQQLAFRGTLSTIVGGAAAAILAARGEGALSLAVQRLVQIAMSSVWVWSAITWRPSFRVGGQGAEGILRQGSSVMTGSVLPLLVPRSVDLFVGFLLGPIQLGLMRVAFRLNDFVGQLILIPLVGVATAQLANQADDIPAMQRSYLGLTQASATLMCPILIGLALVAPEAVPLLFGSHWSASIQLIQILSLLAFAAPINYYFTASMVALGKSRIVLRQGIFQIILGATATAFAAQFSLAAVVAAQVLRGFFVSIYNIADLRRYMKVTLIRFAATLAPPYVSTIMMAVVVTEARAALPAGLHPALILGVLTLLGALTYVGTAVIGVTLGLWPSYLQSIRGLLSSQMRRRFAARSTMFGS